MADIGSEYPTTEQWRWEAEYSRCFTYPSSYLSDTSIVISSPPLNLRNKATYKPIWISSFGSSTVTLHRAADDASSDAIITVSLEGTLIEEHLISKLHFTWPQVSCVSGFPARGGLVVFASYMDHANEIQKFALRFPTVSNADDFISSLEIIFSDNIPKGLPAIKAVSAVSSESEFVPPYRPEVTSVMSPTYASPMPNYSHTEDGEDSHTRDGIADSESNVSGFPPRFTSLLSNCSAQTQHGTIVLAIPGQPKDLRLKDQIVKYMQDASFLDMVTKVNEVISELGEDFVL